MRSLLLVLLVACAPPKVLVRMATSDDMPLAALGSCAVHGMPAPQFIDATIAFGRQHLFGADTRVEWIQPGVPWPARAGVVIDARSDMGLLVLRSGGPGTSAGTVYCLRAIDARTLVIYLLWFWMT